MAASRLWVFMAVLVSVKMMAAQPTFGSSMWCDMMCDDDDDDDYSDGGLFDLLAIFDPCAGCTTSSKPAKSTTTTPSAMQQPFNLIIPPANGMNVTLTPTGNSWLFNFIPWLMPAATTTASASTTAAPATTAGGTTVAAENSTTAKP